MGEGKGEVKGWTTRCEGWRREWREEREEEDGIYICNLHNRDIMEIEYVENWLASTTLQFFLRKIVNKFHESHVPNKDALKKIIRKHLQIGIKIQIRDLQIFFPFSRTLDIELSLSST